MQDSEYIKVKAELEAGSYSMRPLWWILAICLVVVILPIPIVFKVLPGFVIFTLLICAGPFLIISCGGCGCGHPACKYCEFCRMTTEEHEAQEDRISLREKHHGKGISRKNADRIDRD